MDANQQPFGAGAEAARDPLRVRRILVAEDDETVARLIGIVLGKDGYEVVRVSDGAAAVARAARERFDLILLDGSMPILDGFAACRAVCAESMQRGVPIVMLTARHGAEDVAAGFAEGASDYLGKPFSLAQLRARVASWLLRAEGHGSRARRDVVDTG